jgi:hypothetical protein
VADRVNPPLRGDVFLLIERPLIDPKTSKTGRQAERARYMDGVTG